MFSKEEKREMNVDFWNGFKSYMKNHKSSALPRVNWLSYPTNLKHTFVRLHCDEKSSALFYDIQFKDKEIRALFWDQLLELKALFNSQESYSSQWHEHFETEDGLHISRIQWTSSDWSLYQQKDWKKIYRFFKERLLEFDLFYQEYKEILINLIK
jgi:hypothetical protein